MPLKGEDWEAQFVAIALRELTIAGGFQEKGKMSKAGHGVFPSESAIKQHMEWSRRQPLFTTNHVRDVHQMVIYDVRQVIGGELVCAFVEHFVVENRGIDDHITANQVVYMYIFTRLDFETYYILVATCNALFHLFGRKGERIAHVATCRSIILEVGCGFASSIEVFGRVESDVCLALSKELIYVFLVDFSTFTLTVGTFVATEAHAFIKMDAEPFERFNDVVFSSWHKTRRVGVFDAEHEVATMLASEKIVVERGANAADV